MTSASVTDVENDLNELRPSANTHSVKPCALAACLLLAKNMFHSDRPKTVPWYTEFVRGRGAEKQPSTAALIKVCVVRAR